MAITKRRQMKYATKASVQHENKLKKCKTKWSAGQRARAKGEMSENLVNKLLRILGAKSNAAATDNGPIFLTTN